MKYPKLTAPITITMIIATVTTIFLKLLDFEFTCDLLKFLDLILESSFCFSYVLSILLSDIVSLDCTPDNLLPQFSQKEASTEFGKPQF
ncbi:hypothetical protein SMXD51_02828 [Ligilactobacillus salivarius SMXD51]|uniref:Uncharacterized protein n=1 Tax=Ligilactobacillus salivarius SMXD51 TaxID=1108963 RepID=H7FZF8_9LACO|nr:hypothetical protein SMXD51_02828 [Ligilactobacillus salivarius SMXD51]